MLLLLMVMLPPANRAQTITTTIMMIPSSKGWLRHERERVREQLNVTVLTNTQVDKGKYMSEPRYHFMLRTFFLPVSKQPVEEMTFTWIFAVRSRVTNFDNV